MDCTSKSEVVKAAILGIKVAKNQQKYLLETFLKVFPDFDESAFISQSHSFLDIPKKADEWLVIKYLKKYLALLNHMAEIVPIGESYQGAIREAKFQVAQLIQTFVLLSSFNNNIDTTDEGLPNLPEELKIDSMSLRQRRDYLVIRQYERLLNLAENLLQDY